MCWEVSVVGECTFSGRCRWGDFSEGRTDGYFVVSGYSWRPFFGEPIPYLEYSSPDGPGAFPVLGEHYLSLGDVLFCRSCLSPLVSGYDHVILKLCRGCLATSWGAYLRCAVEGAGSSLGVPCNGRDVECGSVDLCRESHVVYVGSFGGILKVGVTRERRGDMEMGCLQRVFEQGLGFAVVFGDGLALWEAQEIESYIRDEFSLNDKILFSEKVAEMVSGVMEDVDGVLRVVQEIEERLGGRVRVLWRGSFSWGEAPRDYDYIWRGGDLFGELIYARGNVAFFDYGGEVVVVNLNDLVGRGICCSEV